MDANPDLFDRARRRRLRERAAPNYDAHAFLKDAMADDIVARVAESGRNFERLLDVGAHDGRLAMRLAVPFSVTVDAAAAFAPSLVADEDQLPFADASFDLIVSAASLHNVNDLPGALIQLRRALQPGGMFIASFVAGETLLALRHDLIASEDAMTGRVGLRVAPMVDVQGAAALLQRAGFTSPVAEIDSFTVRYAGLLAMLDDLRGMGEANALAARMPLRRDVLAASAAQFAARADDDGKTRVPVQVITVTGWAAA